MYIYLYKNYIETSLDAKERHWIWKLETLTPKGLNVADTFHSQNRSSRKIKYYIYPNLLFIFYYY